MATVAAAINNGHVFGNLRKKMMVNGSSDKKFRVKCVSSMSVASDPYQTLQLRPGASESEVKKAFRQLALKYHPDVCKGSNSTMQFQQIYQAYDVLMNTVNGGSTNVEEEEEAVGWGADQDWDLWDEWMGPDYTSNIA